MNNLFRTKPLHLTNNNPTVKLMRCLKAFDLILLGIGGIIGAGIFVLTGIAAATKAGPAIMISFIIAGSCCAFSALSYAELAASIGGCGSAYGYAYAGLGELIAWIIGWDLILEYAISVPTIAVGWSSYFNNALNGIGLTIPIYLLKSPFNGGIINLPAMLIVIFVSIFLCMGVKISAYFNNIMVAIKLAVIGLFIAIAFTHLNTNNWHPFLPFGWSGVMAGASLIFFAYIGFDAVSTAAEEVINPQRNLPIGIIVSLIICTIIYVIVSGLLTGIIPYWHLNVESPISAALLYLNYKFAASIIAVGAIAGLTTVILVMYYGLTRVFLAMSRDNLLPPVFSQINPYTHSPIRIILCSGVVMIILAAIAPITELAHLVNIGTLFAFMIVCIGVIVMRYTKPNLYRPFKIPFSPLIPSLGIIFCVYLIYSLPTITWLRFIIWMLIGLAIYFVYSRKKSLLNGNTIGNR